MLTWVFCQSDDRQIISKLSKTLCQRAYHLNFDDYLIKRVHPHLIKNLIVSTFIVTLKQIIQLVKIQLKNMTILFRARKQRFIILIFSAYFHCDLKYVKNRRELVMAYNPNVIGLNPSSATTGRTRISIRIPLK